jgi:hypothetical protein
MALHARPKEVLADVANLFFALHCLDVPGEGHEVAPITVRLK